MSFYGQELPTHALQADNKKYSKIHSRIDSRLSAKNRPSPFLVSGKTIISLLKLQSALVVIQRVAIVL